MRGSSVDPVPVHWIPMERILCHWKYVLPAGIPFKLLCSGNKKWRFGVFCMNSRSTHCTCGVLRAGSLSYSRWALRWNTKKFHLDIVPSWGNLRPRRKGSFFFFFFNLYQLGGFFFSLIVKYSGESQGRAPQRRSIQRDHPTHLKRPEVQFFFYKSRTPNWSRKHQMLGRAGLVSFHCC